MKQEVLSKTKYCNGVQCPKMLWMKKFKPEEALDVMNEAVLANGRRVGELAREYFGECVNSEVFDENGSLDISAMLAKTVKLMNPRVRNIAEAAFCMEGLYCAVDILHRDGLGWDIVEVKSSSHVSDVYVQDISFQYHVLKRWGVKIKKAFLMYVNSDYVRQGDLDLHQLFVLKDMTKVCQANENQVIHNTKFIRDYLQTEGEPERQIGVYCEKPYLCPFYKYCRGEQPDHSVLDLHSKVKTELKYWLWHQGLKSFYDVYEAKEALNRRKETKLNKDQWQEIECALGYSPDVVNKKGIQAFLSTLRYPIYHLDFETFQEAVPSFDNEKVFSQIPFQYSLHIEHEDGRLEHKEFLAEPGIDPRRAVAEALCRDIPMDVCCTAYFKTFECGRLKELANLFPDLREHLLNISANMRDLFEPFSKRYYYTAEMLGKASIKNVLPALWPNAPELDYSKLEGVHKGDEASAAFITLGEKSPEEQTLIRQQLLKYCGLDTLAMVKILQRLREAVRE